LKIDLNAEINKNKNAQEEITKLKKDLISEKNKNKILNDENTKFKNDLNTEINKNKILNDQITKLKNDLNAERNNEQLNKEIKKLNDAQNNIKEKVYSNTDKDIIKLYKTIDELKEKLSRYPFEMSKGEKLISVIFFSSDENMLHSIISKNTEKFIKLEEKLYNDFPEYSESDNLFIVNGNKVNKFKTLEENKIQNNGIIILSKNEF